jgi:pantoate--beta-alanine ligase
MEIIRTRNILREALQVYKAGGNVIGFVPTMGALHAGHLSLVERSRGETGKTVVSIFVNPAQFNDPNDLDNYPRTLSEDVRKLEAAGCDCVFVPDVQEMYPEKDTRVFDFGGLDQVMEGVHRPGHFNGVAQIVSKLFDTVLPDRAYFGEKDFQQLAIIRHMVETMHYPVEIAGCPIVREPDGLAMSSRNMRLTPEQRKNAPVIAKVLFDSREKIASTDILQLKKYVIDRINGTPGLETEYFEIVDRKSLQSVAEYKENSLQGCIAVYAGTVRLIDNIAY